MKCSLCFVTFHAHYYGRVFQLSPMRMVEMVDFVGFKHLVYIKKKQSLRKNVTNFIQPWDLKVESVNSNDSTWWVKKLFVESIISTNSTWGSKKIRPIYYVCIYWAQYIIFLKKYSTSSELLLFRKKALCIRLLHFFFFFSIVFFYWEIFCGCIIVKIKNILVLNHLKKFVQLTNEPRMLETVFRSLL